MSKPIYQVYDSAVLDAPIEEVWGVLRDIMKLLPVLFGKALQGHQWVDGGSAERIPSRFQLAVQPSGETALHEVVARSEIDHSLTYRNIGGAMGLERYVSTFRLRPVTSEPGKTFIEWPREFGVAAGQDATKLVPFIAAVSAKEVATLKEHFSRRSSR